MNSRLILKVIALILVSNFIFSSEFIVRNAKVHSSSLKDLEGADLHIKDGKFLAIEKELIITGLREINANGRYLTPGLLSPLNHIGLVEIELESDTRDDNSKFYSAGLGISEAFNPSSTLVPYNLSGGITTSLSSPAYNKTLYAGLISAFYLTGSLENSLIKKDIGLLAKIGAGEDSRAASILMLKDSFIQAKKYKLNGKLKDHSKPHQLDFSERDIIAITRVLNQEIPLVVNANRASDLLSLIDIANENKINLIISGAKEGWRVAEQLKNAKIPVIIQPIDNLPSSFDEIGATLENASLLYKSGVKILISSHESHNAYLSRQGAGIAVAYGLPWSEAIDGLSKNIADSFGLESIGSIEIGKSADFIIWDKDPLEVSAFAEKIFIAGEEMSVLSRSSRLKDRYLRKQ